MNEARLIEVLAHIKNHPESWDQRSWFDLTRRQFTPTSAPVSLGHAQVVPVAALPAHCGTAGCVAGWTVQLAPEAQVLLEVSTDHPNEEGQVFWYGTTMVNLEGGSAGLSIETAAAELLGFDLNEAFASDCTYVSEPYEECPGGDEPCQLHEFRWDLFDPNNEWDDLIRIGAFHLGITPEALEGRVNSAARDAQYAEVPR